MGNKTRVISICFHLIKQMGMKKDAKNRMLAYIRKKIHTIWLV